MKNRVKQRANHKLKAMEERLDKRNHYGNKDLTAYSRSYWLTQHRNNPV